MKFMFCEHDSVIFKVSWDNIESLVYSRTHFCNLRSGLTSIRTAMYALSIFEAGAPLDNCVGFTNCPKVQLCSLESSGSNECTCYSEHKRFFCLINQTILR